MNLPQRHLPLLFLLLLVLTSCGRHRTLVQSAPDSRDIALEDRYARMLDASTSFGPGGDVVLTVAYETLSQGRAQDKWPDVGLEDLWAHAIKEGSSLFSDPRRRWGRTTAAETRDMIGKTTIGPWQITLANIRQKYGLPYGIDHSWDDRQLVAYLSERPHTQAAIIADYIQESYDQYGVRTPYAIQRYFWLEAYVRGEIGQGPWDKPVLPPAPGGDWRRLTPELRADTGFYARQILLGTSAQPHSLLYWLCITRDYQAIDDVLAAWSEQTLRTWDESADIAQPTEIPGHFAIQPADLRHIRQLSPESADTILQILNERASAP